MDGLGDSPVSEALLPEEHEPVLTWAGADLVLVDRPLPPPPPDYDPWGKLHRNTFVVTPHALALAWLVSTLMDRVLWRGLLTDKYGFFEQLGRAVNKVLEVRPRASERALIGAMRCATAELVEYCGWEQVEVDQSRALSRLRSDAEPTDAHAVFSQNGMSSYGMASSSTSTQSGSSSTIPRCRQLRAQSPSRMPVRTTSHSGGGS